MKRLPIVLALVLAACTDGGSTPTTPPPSPSPAPTATSSPSPTSSVRLASGEPLPACEPGRPPRDQTVAFFADGAVWTAAPDGSSVTCLTTAPDPGPFLWGPQGDRVLLGGLQMFRTNGIELHDATTITAGRADWGHPVGKAVVFIEPGDNLVQKAFPRSPRIDSIRESAIGAFLNVAYHPSGLALAVIETGADGEEIWITSNVGESIKRLVFSLEGTRFGELGFSWDGLLLYYSAQHADDRPYVHVLDLRDPVEAPAIWKGRRGTRVLAMEASPDAGAGAVAITTGTGCEDQSSLVTTPERGVDLGEVAVVGWLDPGHLVVASGCDGAQDVSVFDLGSGTSAEVVSGVEIAASRAAYPSPPPELPRIPGAGGDEPEEGVG